MGMMMDIIGATVALGMIIMTIMNVNIGMSDENYKSFSEFKTQTELIQLGRILEFDLYKAGYRITKATATTGEVFNIAESSRVKFYTNLFNVAGAHDSVMYGLGNGVSVTTNPRDMMLYRFENTTRVFINYSVVQFKLQYYNSNDSLMGFPITGARLDSIHSVRVQLALETPEPFDTTRTGGYPYIRASYNKLIYPRNL